MKAPKSRIDNLTARLVGRGDKKVLWRWNPGPWLRKRGFKGIDLWADGPIMTADELSAYGFTPPVNLRLKGLQPMSKSAAEETARRLNAFTTPAGAAKPPARPRPPKSINKVFDEYLESSDAKRISPKHLQTTTSHLKFLRATFGPFEPRALTTELILAHVEDAETARGEHAAYKDAQHLRTALNWAQKQERWRGHLPEREVYSELGLQKPGARLRVDFPGEIDAMMLAFDDPHKIYDQIGVPQADRVLLPRPSGGDAMIAQLWTAARVQDALRLIEHALYGEKVVYRPKKTQKKKLGREQAPLTIPALPILKARLEDAIRRKRAIFNGPSNHLEIIINEVERAPYWSVSEKTGVASHKPYNDLWRERRALAASIVPSLGGGELDRTGLPIPALNAQDCRDIAVSRLAAAGCTLWELCAWHGSDPQHMLKLAKHYIEIGGGLAADGGEKLMKMCRNKGISA